MNRKAWDVLLKIFLIANILLILFFWFDGSGLNFSKGFGLSMIALGRLFGLSAVFLVLLQVLLIGRTRWIEQLFGLDKLSRWHHTTGLYAIILIILHPVSLAIGYGIIGKIGFFPSFWSLVTGWSDTVKSLIAAIIFILIIILSIHISKKRMKYETWYYIHVLTYAAIILAFFHQLVDGGDFLSQNLGGAFRIYWIILYIFVALNILLFRFFRPIWNWVRHDFVIDRIESASDSAVSVYIKGKNLEKFKVIPGQFMIWRFLQKGFWLEAHPFSLSGYNLEKDRYIRLTIKNLGDFTSKAGQLKKGTKVLIDGPHGIFTSRIARHEKFLFIAGGVGITPIRAMLEELSLKEKDCILMYANNSRKDILFESEFEKMAKSHDHIKIYQVLSKERGWKGENGYVDKEKIQRLIKDISHREIYVCGPPALMTSVLQSLKELEVKDKQIHYEKFSL